MRVGDVVDGRYRLDHVLGEGGFAVVYRATELESGRTVAIKVLKVAEADMRVRFRREARILTSIRHPNCVAVHGSGETATGAPYLVLEHVAGASLAERRGERLPIDEVTAIGEQIAAALACAHEQGVVHRDLKPENVMIARDAGRIVVKVLDFGIAKVLRPDLPDITKTGEVLGTPYYMSPEQLCARDVGPASDQYALGVILFELIEGRLPFAGADFLSVGHAHLSEPAPDVTRADCPDYLRQIVARLLRKSATRRFPTTGTLARALRDRAMPTAVELAVTDNRRARVVAVGLVCAAIVTVAVVLASSGPRSSPDSPPQLPTALTRAPAPPREEMQAPVEPVVAEPAVDSGSAPQDGCGEPLRDGGLHHFGDHDGGGTTRYVPPTYDPKTPHPLVLVLHGPQEDGYSFLKGSGLVEAAEARGYVLVAPGSFEHPPAEVDAALRGYVDQEARDLCIDRSRLFVVGQHHRAIDALQAACEPWVRGVAIHAFRARELQPLPACPADRLPAPTLAMFPLLAPIHPADGGLGPPRCLGAHEVPYRSVAEMERLMGADRGCESSRPAAQRVQGGECFTWACDAPFQTCHLEGGIIWPGTPRRRADALSPGFQMMMDRCDGAPSDFPAGETVLRFFDSASVLK